MVAEEEAKSPPRSAAGIRPRRFHRKQERRSTAGRGREMARRWRGEAGSAPRQLDSGPGCRIRAATKFGPWLPHLRPDHRIRALVAATAEEEEARRWRERGEGGSTVATRERRAGGVGAEEGGRRGEARRRMRPQRWGGGGSGSQEGESPAAGSTTGSAGR